MEISIYLRSVAISLSLSLLGACAETSTLRPALKIDGVERVAIAGSRTRYRRLEDLLARSG